MRECLYDSLGIPIDVRVTAVLESRTGVESTYRWFADSSDNDPISGGSITVGTGLIRFDGSGNFLSTTNSQISIDRVNIPSSTPLNFVLDFSQVSGLEDNNASLAATRQDRHAPAFFAKQARASAPDPLAASRDDHHFLLESHQDLSLVK